ncbi:nucleolar protein 11 [Anoplophora glabripennis]|uniref:nucleolar protein 11 n=1 Tax=Anoplophora glabripennis TaxID=217634 RepID=UPI000874E21C|nr:nucleolar protein 11 [Anoplophora glabripennis]
MAKLGSYYGLCPLIESKTLLGISEDSEKENVIVTLGKNIAGKYRLSDQKQVCCWKTKEKFSSPVLYDKKSSKYVAAFNQSYIKLWSYEDENLDKLKKYKFNQQIYTIFSNNEDTFVLFENGNLYTLAEALESRKTLNFEGVISNIEKIDDVLYAKVNDQFYVGLIVRSEDELYLYWTKYNSAKCVFIKKKLYRDTLYSLKGCVIHVMENTAHLLTLWSDGRIFSYILEESDMPFPGELFTVIQHISTKYTVCISALDENYMAMFGANSNEEGAILIIYNTQFKVTQSKQSFKLFTNGAKLWNYENNLLLPVGQNLAVIPYYLETEQLAALIGSHKSIQSETNADVTLVQETEIVSWDHKFKLGDKQIPETLKLKMNDLLKQGLPESIILEELLIVIFRNQDINFLSLCIDYFSDIPEKYIAKLLKYLTVLDCTAFPNQLEHPSKSFPSDLQPISRTELIDKILCKPFSEILLLPYLRSELTLSNVVTLLNYICFLWSEDGHLLPVKNVVKNYEKLIEWSFVIIDANYQKLLLSKDNSVMEALNNLNNLILQHLSSFEDLKFLSTVLNYFKMRKPCSNGIGTNNMKYSVEQVCLY